MRIINWNRWSVSLETMLKWLVWAKDLGRKYFNNFNVGLQGYACWCTHYVSEQQQQHNKVKPLQMKSYWIWVFIWTNRLEEIERGWTDRRWHRSRSAGRCAVCRVVSGAGLLILRGRGRLSFSSASEDLQGWRGGPKSSQEETKLLKDMVQRCYYTAGLQKPEGVKTFMSRGFSLCGFVGACLVSIPEISILGGLKLAGSSTLKLTWVLVPSMVEDLCMPK